MFVGRDICHFRDKMRKLIKAIKFSLRQTLITHFEFKVCHDRNKISVAATFADSIDRTLHLNCAFTYRGQRIDNSAFRVIVSMDSEWMCKDRLEVTNDFLYFPRHRAAVGVTQNDGLRATADGCLESFQGIRGVCFITIKEMFSIIDHALAMGFKIGNRLFNDTKVIFKRGQQYFLDMQSPRLAKDRADRRLRIEQCFDVGIVFRSTFDTAGRAKCSNQCVLPWYITSTLEEFNIFWIRPRPATFDKGHTEFIQFLCDADFVIARKCKTFRLRPIAESSVINLNFFFFNDTATTEIYTLSLHDALPIYPGSDHVQPGKQAEDCEKIGAG